MPFKKASPPPTPVTLVVVDMTVRTKGIRSHVGCMHINPSTMPREWVRVSFSTRYGETRDRLCLDFFRRRASVPALPHAVELTIAFRNKTCRRDCVWKFHHRWWRPRLHHLVLESEKQDQINAAEENNATSPGSGACPGAADTGKVDDDTQDVVMAASRGGDLDAKHHEV